MIRDVISSIFTHQSIINHHLPAAGNHPSQSSSPPPPQPINIHQKYQKQFDSLGFLLLLRMNWLCAFEIEEVHDVNMIDSSFVPRTGCLEILGNAVLLQQFDEVIGMKGTSGEVLWTIVPSLHASACSTQQERYLFILCSSKRQKRQSWPTRYRSLGNHCPSPHCCGSTSIADPCLR